MVAPEHILQTNLEATRDYLPSLFGQDKLFYARPQGDNLWTFGMEGAFLRQSRRVDADAARVQGGDRRRRGPQRRRPLGLPLHYAVGNPHPVLLPAGRRNALVTTACNTIARASENGTGDYLGINHQLGDSVPSPRWGEGQDEGTSLPLNHAFLRMHGQDLAEEHTVESPLG